MKLSLSELDDEIREIETRIELDRLALEEAVTGCTNSLRDTVTSPKTLLALLGIGYAVGKLMFGRKAPEVAAAAPKVGVVGVLTGLAGTALSLMQPRFNIGSIARWAASKAFAPRESASAGGRAARPRTPAGIS